MAENLQAMKDSPIDHVWQRQRVPPVKYLAAPARSGDGAGHQLFTIRYDEGDTWAEVIEIPGVLGNGNRHQRRTYTPPMSTRRRASGVDVGDVTMGGVRFVYLSARETPAPRIPGLTAAERDVARLAAADLSNAEIAARRGVSARTVANQLASIFRKLKLGSRVELIARLTR